MLVTLKMDDMGHVHVFNGRVPKLICFNRNRRCLNPDTLQEANTYLQVDTDIEYLKSQLTPKQRDDLEGGFTVITTIEL